MRTTVFGIAVDAIDLGEAVSLVLGWTRESATGRVVVTPNLDHAVLLRQNPDFREAYAKASLVVADGAPLVWASRVGGELSLPERVAGSDLVPALLKRGGPLGINVFLFGAMPGVAVRAGQQIEALYPGVKVVGAMSPPFGFENDEAYCEEVVRRVGEARPDLLLVGLGAPKQELWSTRYAHKLNAKVILCVGATIDFLAGHVSRAPHWMQKSGLEWFYRASTEPRRLIPRYLKNAFWLLPLMIEQVTRPAPRPSASESNASAAPPGSQGSAARTSPGDQREC